MMSEKLTRKELNQKAAKAGTAFVIVQLLVRGITFFLTPVYTRLVSTAQYGEIRTYESWLLIVVPVFSMCLYRSVSRAKYDYPDNFNGYVSSVQTLSWLCITIGYLVILLFFRTPFMQLCILDTPLLIIMILFTYSNTSVFFFQHREKQMLRYKQSIIATACMMIPATVCSLLLLWWGNQSNRQDQLVLLRVIGYYSPQILCGLFLAFVIWKDGGFKANRKYWKYALLFSLPLIPETLSLQIMNQSDKIMIRKMVDAESAGVYALAANLSFIIWLIEDAVWGALLPWLYEKISRDETADVHKTWNLISLFFGYLSGAIVILGPELIALLGGAKYQEAVWLVAPMVSGTLIRFYGSGFTAELNYRKKTHFTALGALTAMILNVILNAICIHFVGYQAAAYTTAFSYFMLMILQGLLEKKTCGLNCVSLFRMILMAIGFTAVNLAIMFLYPLPRLIRWGILALVSGIAAWKVFPEALKICKMLGIKG